LTYNKYELQILKGGAKSHYLMDAAYCPSLLLTLPFISQEQFDC
jgi:hypothetical protein